MPRRTCERRPVRLDGYARREQRVDLAAQLMELLHEHERGQCAGTSRHPFVAAIRLTIERAALQCDHEPLLLDQGGEHVLRELPPLLERAVLLEALVAARECFDIVVAHCGRHSASRDADRKASDRRASASLHRVVRSEDARERTRTHDERASSRTYGTV